MPKNKSCFPSPPIVITSGCSRIKSYFSCSGSRSSSPPPKSLLPREPCRRNKAGELEIESNRRLGKPRTGCRPEANTKGGETRQAGLRPQLIRLEDGSYLHRINNLGKPWGSLVIHISGPAIVENSSSATEVIHRMASMEVEELQDCLFKSLEMKDISGCKPSEIRGKLVLPGYETGFTEAIVLSSIENMSRLVLEGLRIQISYSARRSKEMEEKLRSRETITKEEGIVLVILIQVRDPDQEYEAVGDLMIGLIEASDKDSYIVHVAGIKCENKGTLHGEHIIWNASV